MVKIVTIPPPIVEDPRLEKAPPLRWITAGKAAIVVGYTRILRFVDVLGALRTSIDSHRNCDRNVDTKGKTVEWDS